jgi:nucleoside-diphosphate-sugar epimerase
VVFTSSVAVFGGTLPKVVQEDTAVKPQSSYGTQKAIAELLLSDYSRRGYVDGRVLRLATISVRPGRPNKAASSFASGIIREPLHGEAAVCPVPPGTRLWLASPGKAIEALIAGHDLPGDALGDSRTINMPGISVSAAEMVDALARVAGEEVAAWVRWEEDALITRIVASWPGAWNNARAEALGLSADKDVDAIIEAYMADDLGET